MTNRTTPPAGGRRRSRLSRLVRWPVLHFLMIGAALQVADAWWAASTPQPPEPLVLTAQQIGSLRSDFRRRHGRPPKPNEEDALVDQAIDEEILFRKALAMGIDRENPFVEYRLATVMRYLRDGEGGTGPDAEVPTDGELIEEARRLGLHRSDLVIRRHLVEMARLVAKRASRPETFTGEELRETLEQNAARYRRPARVALTHVFLSRDRRGASVHDDALDLLERLRSDDVPTEEAPSLGDPFLHGYELPPLSEQELLQRFGPDFAARVPRLPEGVWQGPVPSSYGVHLVRIREKIPPQLPDVAEIRSQLVQRLRHERSEERLARKLERWRQDYDVRIQRASEARAGGDDPEGEVNG